MRKFLGLTRYAVVVPAIASMIGTLLLMVQGSIEILIVVFDSIFKGSYLKVTIVVVLTAVDAILLGTVLLVFGFRPSIEAFWWPFGICTRGLNLMAYIAPQSFWAKKLKNQL